MAVLTRDDVYNKMLNDEKPKCPHCGKRMVVWECPPVGFSDGLGWGTPYLYVCFNDECPPYVKGWDNIMDSYAVRASYRCICDPISSSGKMDSMPVFSPEGGKGGIVDDELEAKKKANQEAMQKALDALETAKEAKEQGSILEALLDDKALPPVAFRAAELIGEMGTLDAIEPIRNHAFNNELVREKAEAGLELIHKRNFTKECPFCAEIIKARAVVCKHCKKDLPEK